ATFNADQFAAAVPGAGGILLGGTQFEFEDEEWKGPPATANDSSFGVYTFPWPAAPGTPSAQTTAPNGASGSYVLDPLTPKPSLASMRDAFSSTWNITARATGGSARAAAPGWLDARDVVQLDRHTGEHTVLLDGSRAGLRKGNALQAVTTAPDGESLLISPRRPAKLGGAGRVEANDIVRYDIATKRFTKVTRVGGAPIDAIAEPPEGGLIVSRVGSSGLLQRTGRRWEPIATGRQLGLRATGEDIDSLWANPANGHLYVSTAGASRTGQVKLGGGAEVLALSRRDGGWHARVVLRAEPHGLDGAQVRGFAIAD
ncbi:MAG TPA: hypothetical protein VIL49_05110, partial [Capillimicrobium sp.]